MKKSRLYYLAQTAVVRANNITDERKLEILRELMDKEDLEIFREQKEAGEIK